MRSLLFRLTLVSVLQLTIFAAGAHAAAATGARLVEDDVDDLTARATKLRHGGDDEGALPLYQQAYDRSKSPAAAARLALCKQALGQWAEAETYLTEGLKASDDPWIRKNRRQLEQSLVAIKTHIARIEVIGEPVGAEVIVNGSGVGKLPLPSLVRVSAGEVQIEVRSPGYNDVTRTLRVEGGAYQKVAIRLSPTPGGFASGGGSVGARPTAPPPASGAALGPAPLGSSSAAPASVLSAPQPSATLEPAGGLAGAANSGTVGTESRATTAWRPRYKWIAWGGAALSLGVGIYGWTENRSGVKDFNTGCGIDGPTGQVRAILGSGRTDAQCDDLKGDYESASRLGIGGFVGAGVLGALGAILWMTEPADVPGTAAGVAYACRPTTQLDSTGRNIPRVSAGMTCAWFY